MKTYTEAELKEVLRLHKLWRDGDPEGTSANLSVADLSWANLRGADLRGANLRGADLGGANLRGANLRGADLRGANLSNANFRGANLSDANLRRANLAYTDLRGAEGIEIFIFEQDLAIQYLDRIMIGCKDDLISGWLENYETIGKENNYTPKQIEAYGEFIKQCAKEINK